MVYYLKSPDKNELLWDEYRAELHRLWISATDKYCSLLPVSRALCLFINWYLSYDYDKLINVNYIQSLLLFLCFVIYDNDMVFWEVLTIFIYKSLFVLL